MSVASDLRQAVKDLMSEHGTASDLALTLRQVPRGAYDVTTGVAAAGTPVDYTGVGRVGTYRDAMIDGTRILQGDRRCTFMPDNSSVQPAEGDLILIGGTPRYTVVDCQIREVGNAAVVHTLQVRGMGAVLR